MHFKMHILYILQNAFDEGVYEIKIFQCNNLQEQKNKIGSHCLSGPEVVNNTKTIEYFLHDFLLLNFKLNVLLVFLCTRRDCYAPTEEKSSCFRCVKKKKGSMLAAH